MMEPEPFPCCGMPRGFGGACGVATVQLRGQPYDRIRFAGGNSQAYRSYGEIALRRESAKGTDKPE